MFCESIGLLFIRPLTLDTIHHTSGFILFPTINAKIASILFVWLSDMGLVDTFRFYIVIFSATFVE